MNDFPEVDPTGSDPPSLGVLTATDRFEEVDKLLNNLTGRLLYVNNRELVAN